MTPQNGQRLDQLSVRVVSLLGFHIEVDRAVQHKVIARYHIIYKKIHPFESKLMNDERRNYRLD